MSAGFNNNVNHEEGTDTRIDNSNGDLLELRRKFNSYHDFNPYISGSWALERAADNQERELDGVVNTAVGILGPVMILLMGGFVFVIVIALLLPIFQLNQLVG